MEASAIMFLRGLGGASSPSAPWEFHPPTSARWRLSTAHFPSSHQQWEALPVSQYSPSDPRKLLDHCTWVFLPQIVGNLIETEQITHYWGLERENNIWDSLRSVINGSRSFPLSCEHCFSHSDPQSDNTLLLKKPNAMRQWQVDIGSGTYNPF